MLSAVLRSETAVVVSVRIIDAFVEMRNAISRDGSIIKRLDSLEQSRVEADRKFDKIFSVIESRTLNKKEGIFFNGQVFDAYVFIIELIKVCFSKVVPLLYME